MGRRTRDGCVRPRPRVAVHVSAGPFYEHPTGGHVAALDAPAAFVADLADLIHRTGDPR